MGADPRGHKRLHVLQVFSALVAVETGESHTLSISPHNTHSLDITSQHTPSRYHLTTHNHSISPHNTHPLDINPLHTPILYILPTHVTHSLLCCAVLFCAVLFSSVLYCLYLLEQRSRHCLAHPTCGASDRSGIARTIAQR